MKTAAQLIAEFDGKPLIDLVEEAMRQGKPTNTQSAQSSAQPSQQVSDLPPLPEPCQQVISSGWVRYTADQMRDYALAAIQSAGISAAGVPQWISVADRLPTIRDAYYLCSDGKQVWKEHFTTAGFFGAVSAKHLNHRSVAYWTELPATPDAQEKKA